MIDSPPKSRVPVSRRSFLTAAVAVAASTPLKAAAPGAVIQELKVISQPQYYHGWPTLAGRANGELVLAVSGGRESHVCPFGWVELMRSQDAGKTWLFPRVLMDTAIDDRDAGVVETAKGSLLVTTFTSLAYEPILARAEEAEAGGPHAMSPEQLAAWRGAHRRTDAWARQRMLGTWMLRSADGGVTWSAPYRVPVNSPHGPVSLKDGRLLYAGVALWEPERTVGVCLSSDDGQTWNRTSPLPVREGDLAKNYHELHAVETKGGRWIVHIRNHNPANYRETLQTESDDGGKTWSTPHSIGVWGLPSHLLRLRDGRLLMSYGYRREPFGNQARISADEGRTWSQPIVLSADGASVDLGYPSTIENDDGTLVTIWYEKLRSSPNAVLRQATWRLTR